MGLLLKLTINSEYLDNTTWLYSLIIKHKMPGLAILLCYNWTAGAGTGTGSWVAKLVQTWRQIMSEMTEIPS